MIPAFDIFKKEPGGRFVWLRAATTLDQANAAVRRLNDPISEFIIVNEYTGERTTIKPAQAP